MNKFSRSVAVGVALFALGVGAPYAQSRAQADTKTNTAAKSNCTMDDAAKVRSVMQIIHTANQAEIKVGKLAQSKTKNADVKAFADHMVKDHTDADKKLTDLAAKQNIDLDAAMTDPLYVATKAMHDTHAQELSGKNGAAFDIAYISGEPADHLMVLKVIEEGQKVAKDDAKKALDEAHTMVMQHKEHAEKTVGMLQMPTAKGIGGGPNKETPMKESPMKKDSPMKEKSPE
jgi:putative membrane protein